MSSLLPPMWPREEVSWLSRVARFKAIAGLVKETKESTRDAVQTLCKI